MTHHQKKYIGDFVLLVISLLFILTSCGKSNEKITNKAETLPIIPKFNADSAYNYIKIQTDFGPRVPGTEAHRKCAQFLVSKLSSFSAKVTKQELNFKYYDGTEFIGWNIIGSFNTSASDRIILCSHWDSRRIADQDKKDRDKPI